MTTATLPPNRGVTDLLQRLASIAPGEQADLEVTDYAWRTPHRFLAEELAQLDAFAQGVAESISGNLGSLLRTPLDLSVTPVTQHYGAGLGEDLAETADYCIDLATEDGRPVGLLMLEATRVKGWVSRILGGSVTGDSPERELSTVERGLMLDIVAVLVEAISARSTQAGGPAFRRSGDLAKGAPDLPGDETAEYTRLSIAQEGSQQPDISLVILSDVAGNIAGGERQQSGRSAEDVEKDIRPHLGQLPVAATVRLGHVQLTLRDLLGLEPGDVLVTDTRIGEPIELQVQGQSVMAGLPVQSLGKYALMITAGIAESSAASPGAPA